MSNSLAAPESPALEGPQLRDHESRAIESLHLRGDGLGPNRFGDGLSTVSASIAGKMGSAKGDAATSCESGSDTLIFWEDFYIVGDRDRFVRLGL
jgi:hypothetical protein